MFAQGKTVISNIANLRIKESDRLGALAAEIKKFGVEVRELADGIEIIGNPSLLSPTTYQLSATTSSYNDHRMAMSFAVAKLGLPAIMIENPECVKKSFPAFWEEWEKIMKHKA